MKNVLLIFVLLPFFGYSQLPYALDWGDSKDEVKAKMQNVALDDYDQSFVKNPKGGGILYFTRTSDVMTNQSERIDFHFDGSGLKHFIEHHPMSQLQNLIRLWASDRPFTLNETDVADYYIGGYSDTDIRVCVPRNTNVFNVKFKRKVVSN